MEVRAEKPEDLEAIRRVNVAAFGREEEADLLDRLRGAASTFSFVCTAFRHYLLLKRFAFSFSNDKKRIIRVFGFREGSLMRTQEN